MNREKKRLNLTGSSAFYVVYVCRNILFFKDISIMRIHVSADFQLIEVLLIINRNSKLYLIQI
jgi:hypothetical protein